MEMFPHLEERKAELLSKTGDDLSVIVTRIIDNNIDPPSVEVKDFTRAQSTKYVKTKCYNYPEVFLRNCNVDLHLDVSFLRRQAAILNKEAADLGKKAMSFEIKEARYHFSIEAEKKREKAKELNYKAGLILMRKNIEKNGDIDLHGFTVEEAGKFIDDLYVFKKFDKIRFITGQAYNSQKIRPMVVEWLDKHGFNVYNEGAVVFGVKKITEMYENRY